MVIKVFVVLVVVAKRLPLQLGHLLQNKVVRLIVRIVCEVPASQEISSFVAQPAKSTKECQISAMRSLEAKIHVLMQQ